MKMEKKIIVLCMFALAIGIATALPLSYLTSRTAPTDQMPEGQIFDVDIRHINVTPVGGGELADVFSGDAMEVVANFTTNPKAIELGDTGAKIEVFNFHVYSDQTSIANITVSIVLSTNISDPNDPNIRDSNIQHRLDTAIWAYSSGRWGFADGTIFDLKDVIGDTEETSGNSLHPHLTKLAEKGYFIGYGWAVLSEANGEKSAQALVNLRSAKTIYVDVTRIVTVTYRHQAVSDPVVSSLTTTFGSDKVLCHTKLVKSDDGFTIGDVSDSTRNVGGIITNFKPQSTSTTTQTSAQAGIINSLLRKPIA